MCMLHIFSYTSENKCYVLFSRKSTRTVSTNSVSLAFPGTLLKTLMTSSFIFYFDDRLEACVSPELALRKQYLFLKMFCYINWISMRWSRDLWNKIDGWLTQTQEDNGHMHKEEKRVHVFLVFVWTSNPFLLLYLKNSTSKWQQP